VDLHWEKMDIAQIERWIACFSKLRTLEEAEAVFGPIQVEQGWRGIPQRKHPGLGKVQLELQTDPKGKSTMVVGASLGLAEPFSAPLQSLESKFGKCEKLPQFPHYDSPIHYSFKTMQGRDTYLNLRTNYQSAEAALRVEGITLRRLGEK